MRKNRRDGAESIAFPFSKLEYLMSCCGPMHAAAAGPSAVCQSAHAAHAACTMRRWVVYVVCACRTHVAFVCARWLAMDQTQHQTGTAGKPGQDAPADVCLYRSRGNVLLYVIKAEGP